MLKKIRIFILLCVLAGTAFYTWSQRYHATDWNTPLWMVVYPVNADGSAIADEYIAQLQEQDFDSIEAFFNQQAKEYALSESMPFKLILGEPVDELPPVPPPNGSILDVMSWSLQMRWWAYQHNSFDGPAKMQMYLLYYDAQQYETLPHSYGLEKGMVSVSNLFAHAKMRRQNHVVIGHEMLHMLGATDKYNLSNTLPSYPAGYAEPERSPLYPQRFAELMGGRIPLNEHKAKIPDSLEDVLIGNVTAKEINWLTSD